MSKKVVIVGGVAGGASTAARLRRLDEHCEIIMLEKGEHISFANCGLPYYIGDVITDRQKLLLQTPEKMKKSFNIDVRVKNEVISVDKSKKQVKIKDLNTNYVYTESYDVLVLSPGAIPTKLSIKGLDLPNIYTLRDVDDTDNIKSFVDLINPQSAVVVGAGFIGLEMAENLRERGLKVTVVEKDIQVMNMLDREMAAFVHRELQNNGVGLYLDNGVSYFEQSDTGINVHLQNGTIINTDMVVWAIGVRPNDKLAKEANLKIHNNSGIIVNEYLQTSDPNIYAIGDVIMVNNMVTRELAHIPLAGPANRQGRIVANNICGKKEKYLGTLGTSVAKVFDLTVTSTGANEKNLKQANIDYKSLIIHPLSHAGYYPGAALLTVKVLFSPINGALLGAQVIGYDGADKRIDILATAIKFNKTVYDLKDVELAYAPPYGSAKDPVNMVGFVGENMLAGMLNTIEWYEIEQLNLNDYAIIDVRTELEFNMSHIKGAINIHIEELRESINKVPQNKKLVLYCKTGVRAYLASQILKQNGFKNILNLNGSYDLYRVVKEDCDKGTCIIPDLSQDYQKVEKEVINNKTIKLDACGLMCPGPIMKVYQAVREMQNGDVLEVVATDSAFSADIEAWCKRTKNTLLEVSNKKGQVIAKIQKGLTEQAVQNSKMMNNSNFELPQGKTMVVFSGDLDKAIASFIIANGAASMGRKVTMFFTFWGLNVLRKSEPVSVKKGFIESMFSKMMPRGSKKLGLSKMNMAGMGSKMIRAVMKSKNVSSLEQLIEEAIKNGVEIIACQMSMDIMGITKQELIDGVKFGGVAAYLGEAEESNVNLFI